MAPENAPGPEDAATAYPAAHANVADVAAPAALTSAQIAGGESPTEAEFNALQADVAALRATVAAAIVALNSGHLST